VRKTEIFHTAGPVLTSKIKWKYPVMFWENIAFSWNSYPYNACWWIWIVYKVVLCCFAADFVGYYVWRRCRTNWIFEI